MLIERLAWTAGLDGWSGRLVWTAAAWDDYLHGQGQDRRQLRSINQLTRPAGAIPLRESVNPSPCGTTWPAVGHAASMRNIA
jgi:hypothetical protein